MLKKWKENYKTKYNKEYTCYCDRVFENTNRGKTKDIRVNADELKINVLEMRIRTFRRFLKHRDIWIPVESHKPDVGYCHDKNVIMSLKSGKVVAGRFLDYQDEVTHWMPLPEPPIK